MKPINVAILGQGRSGRDIHGRALNMMGNLYKIQTVADPIAGRRERAEREYGCKAVEDWQEVLAMADIDLVINSLPSHMHVEATLTLMEAGFNVLCEKPAARTASEIDALAAAAGSTGKLVTIFQEYRFMPYVIKLREIIASGVLGRLVAIKICFNCFQRRWDWQTVQDFCAGCLYNTGPHPMDMALLLSGITEMPEVFSVLDRVNSYGDAEDYAKVLLRQEGKPLVEVEISPALHYGGPVCTIHGSQGSAIATASEIQWKYFLPNEAPEQNLILEPLSQPDGTPAYCSEPLRFYEQSWKDSGQDAFLHMTQMYYKALAETLAGRATQVVTLEQVRLQIAIFEQCHAQNPLPKFVDIK